MNKVLSFLLTALFALGPTRAQTTTPPPTPVGSWVLKTVTCDDGQAAILNFDQAILKLETVKVQLLLTKAQCQMNFAGDYKLIEADGKKLLSTDFEQGNWQNCSGLIPAVLQNQVEWKMAGAALQLSGADLFPLASCEGLGGTMNFELAP